MASEENQDSQQSYNSFPDQQNQQAPPQLSFPSMSTIVAPSHYQQQQSTMSLALMQQQQQQQLLSQSSISSQQQYHHQQLNHHHQLQQHQQLQLDQRMKRRRFSRRGRKNLTTRDKHDLIVILEENSHLVRDNDWDAISIIFNRHACGDQRPSRTGASLRSAFSKLRKRAKPSGDNHLDNLIDHANRLHSLLYTRSAGQPGAMPPAASADMAPTTNFAFNSSSNLFEATDGSNSGLGGFSTAISDGGGAPNSSQNSPDYYQSDDQDEGLNNGLSINTTLTGPVSSSTVTADFSQQYISSQKNLSGLVQSAAQDLSQQSQNQQQPSFRNVFGDGSLLRYDQPANLFAQSNPTPTQPKENTLEYQQPQVRDSSSSSSSNLFRSLASSSSGQFFNEESRVPRFAMGLSSSPSLQNNMTEQNPRFAPSRLAPQFASNQTAQLDPRSLVSSPRRHSESSGKGTFTLTSATGFEMTPGGSSHQNSQHIRGPSDRLFNRPSSAVFQFSASGNTPAATPPSSLPPSASNAAAPINKSPASNPPAGPTTTSSSSANAPSTASSSSTAAHGKGSANQSSSISPRMNSERLSQAPAPTASAISSPPANNNNNSSDNSSTMDSKTAGSEAVPTTGAGRVQPQPQGFPKENHQARAMSAAASAGSPAASAGTTASTNNNSSNNNNTGGHSLTAPLTASSTSTTGSTQANTGAASGSNEQSGGSANTGLSVSTSLTRDTAAPTNFPSPLSTTSASAVSPNASGTKTNNSGANSGTGSTLFRSHSFNFHPYSHARTNSQPNFPSPLGHPSSPATNSTTTPTNNGGNGGSSPKKSNTLGRRLMRNNSLTLGHDGQVVVGSSGGNSRLFQQLTTTQGFTQQHMQDHSMTGGVMVPRSYEGLVKENGRLSELVYEMRERLLGMRGVMEEVRRKYESELQDKTQTISILERRLADATLECGGGESMMGEGSGDGASPKGSMMMIEGGPGSESNARLRQVLVQRERQLQDTLADVEYLRKQMAYKDQEIESLKHLHGMELRTLRMESAMRARSGFKGEDVEMSCGDEGSKVGGGDGNKENSQGGEEENGEDEGDDNKDEDEEEKLKRRLNAAEIQEEDQEEDEEEREQLRQSLGQAHPPSFQHHRSASMVDLKPSVRGGGEGMEDESTQRVSGRVGVSRISLGPVALDFGAGHGLRARAPGSPSKGGLFSKITNKFSSGDRVGERGAGDRGGEDGGSSFLGTLMRSSNK